MCLRPHARSVAGREAGGISDACPDAVIAAQTTEFGKVTRDVLEADSYPASTAGLVCEVRPCK